ncbi:MAG: type II toxin-antitoxin system RelE/ParE family toxin [Planctomycetota bacterium]
MKIKFTPQGRAQFLSVVKYIQSDNSNAALLLRSDVESKLRRLVTFPESGRAIPEFPDFPFREVIVGNYRFFYKVQNGTIWIVAVWHGAQFPNSPA